jgi:hypothetical protein
MPYQILVFFHVGSMFLATALAIGPSTMLFLTARSGDHGAIKRTFGFATPVYRVGGAAYGLGIFFGVLTALSGSIDLTTPWLVTSYALVFLLIATNLVFERWTRRVEAAAKQADGGAQDRLQPVLRDRVAALSLSGMVLITLGIVFVMVVKPSAG